MTDIVRRLRQPPFGTETSERNLMAEAADEIERLRRRGRVLEQVIVEEVDVMACQDGANQSIVEMILKERVEPKAQ